MSNDDQRANKRRRAEPAEVAGGPRFESHVVDVVAPPLSASARHPGSTAFTSNVASALADVLPPFAAVAPGTPPVGTAPFSHVASSRPSTADGDEAMQNHSKASLAIRNPVSQQLRAPSAVEMRSGGFEEEYSVGEILGHGTFSIVRRCTHKATGEARAVKIIDTSKFRLGSGIRGAGPSTVAAQVLEEVKILSALSQHPHIISLFDMFDQPFGPDKHECILIVTEVAPGGELFDSIIKAGNFTEAQARHVMWQALSALEFMHARGVIHRDLKPENLLVFDTVLVPVEDPIVRPHVNYPSLAAHPASKVAVPATRSAMLQIKLADFGVARYVGAAASSGASTFVGSPQYVAPEVLFARGGKSTYGRPIDVYSMGVVLYVCLAGYLPFDDNAPRPADSTAASPGETWEDRVKAGRFYFAPPVWTHISENAKDLIRKMMELDPGKRVTVAQALQHPFFAPIREVNAIPTPVSVDSSSLPDMTRLHFGSPAGAGHTKAAIEPSSTAITTFTSGGFFGRPSQASQPAIAFNSSGVLVNNNGGSPSSANTPSISVFGPQPPSPFAARPGEGPGAATTPVAGGMGNPLGPLPREHQLQVLQTVARSLDFEMLMTLQKATAETFKAAYNAVAAIPPAALVIRRHAVHCRDLQMHGVKKVVLRCRSIAQSILGLLPDLLESIVDADHGLTQGCFAKMKEWVTELRNEAQTMKTAYSTLIGEVQESLEQARSLQFDASTPVAASMLVDNPTPSSASGHHVHDGGGSGAPWSSSSTAFVEPPRVSSLDGESLSSATPASPTFNAASTSLHAGTSSPMRTTVSPLPSLDPQARIRPERATALTEAVLSRSVGAAAEAAADAGDDMMDLILDPPSVIGNQDRFTNAWRTLHPSTPSAAPPVVGGGGPLRKQSTGASEQTSSSYTAAGSPRGADTALQVKQGGPVSPRECLGWALNALHEVDVILTQAIDFWTSMELVTDVVARRKEHSETLLKFSTSSRMIAKATASLQDYSAFWQAFAYLCGTYAEAISTHTRDMYAWLAVTNESDFRRPLAIENEGLEANKFMSSHSIDSMIAESHAGRNAGPSALDELLVGASRLGPPLAHAHAGTAQAFERR